MGGGMALSLASFKQGPPCIVQALKDAGAFLRPNPSGWREPTANAWEGGRSGISKSPPVRTGLYFTDSIGKNGLAEAKLLEGSCLGSAAEQHTRKSHSPGC